MKLTERKLRKVIRQLINEDRATDIDIGEFDLDPGQEGHPEAPDAVASSVDRSRIDKRGGSKTDLMIDAWKAAGGVWRFSEALRFYATLNRGRKQGTSVNHTVGKLLDNYGRRVFDDNGNKAWALRGFEPSGLRSRQRPISRWG